jgi:hypothetical protein
MSLEYNVIRQEFSMGIHDIIRFQIINYCFVNGLSFSPNQIKTLTFLAEWGDMNISDFCQQIADAEIYSSAQTVRNFILDCVKTGIVIRNGNGDKLINITPDAKLLCEGNILITMKVYTDAKTQES